MIPDRLVVSGTRPFDQDKTSVSHQMTQGNFAIVSIPWSMSNSSHGGGDADAGLDGWVAGWLVSRRLSETSP